MTVSFFSASLASWRAAYERHSYARPVDDAAQAVVRLSIKTSARARTAQSLGAEREGTGAVIAPDGLILTIGYLVLEAESILVMTHDGRIYPAHVVGFDHASGFGLIRTAPGVCRHNLELGDSDSVRELHMCTVAAHVASGGLSMAAIVGRRRFTGWWEYMVDDAIFAAPPRHEHSGAALVDAHGRLVGIASLWVSDVLDLGVAFPGNMFVPVNILKPILDELVSDGRRRGPGRPWLGVYSEQHEGHVIVSSVMPDSPADHAGLSRGDLILGVDGESIGGQSEFYTRLWESGEAGDEVTLHVLHGKKVKEVTVRSADRLDYLNWKPAG